MTLQLLMKQRRLATSVGRQVLQHRRIATTAVGCRLMDVRPGVAPAASSPFGARSTFAARKATSRAFSSSGSFLEEYRAHTEERAAMADGYGIAP